MQSPGLNCYIFFQEEQNTCKHRVQKPHRNNAVVPNSSKYTVKEGGNMIEFQNICKTYRVAKRQAGFTNAVKSLFSREYETIHALDDVSFRITDGGVVFGQRTQLWWDVPAIDSFELLRTMYKIDDKLYRKNLDELTRCRSHNLRKYEDERVQSKPADNLSRPSHPAGICRDCRICIPNRAAGCFRNRHFHRRSGGRFI